MKKLLLLILFLIVFVMPVFAKQHNSDDDFDKKTTEYLNLEWWKVYEDDFLTSHLQKLYQENYDLKNAQLKVKENEKLIKIQLAQELPSLTFDGFISRDFRSSMQKFGDMSIPSYSQSNFQLPLTMAYEIDIWGKNHLKTKMNKERLEIAKQAQRAAYITLTSDFTAQYFNLIKTDKLLSLQNKLIEIQSDIVSKTKDKFEAGLCSVNEVLNEEKILTKFNEEKNTLEDDREVFLNVLRVYLAQAEGEIERKSFEDVKLPENIPLEINSEIINNRPDYIMTESELRRSGYDVRIARKELLPSFVIFGQIGLNAYSLSSMFKSASQFANAGIMPAFDLFSGGRKIAFLQFKKYQYDEALNNYKKTILEDIKEVNLGLSGYKTALKNYNESVKRVNKQNQLNKLMKEKNEIGAASKLETLYSDEADILTLKEEVSDKINCLISIISLYKAVGGKNLYKIEENI